MGTTTSLKIGVDLLTQSTVFASNSIVQVAFRVEAGRTQGGHYMMNSADEIEKALKIWLREQTLRRVTLELYSPASDTCYEKCVMELSYVADPKTEATKPPVAELEALFATLEKLPSDAKFRFLVECAPGATEVPGWVPSEYKPLAGGLKADHKVGTGGHGYGHISSEMIYYESNWQQVQGNG